MHFQQKTTWWNSIGITELQHLSIVLSLAQTEEELKKRTRFRYDWGGVKQNNLADRDTAFIYDIETFDGVICEVRKRFGGAENLKAIGNYAVNRWYNFMSAKAVEDIFRSHQAVSPPLNTKDRLCDFFLRGIPFDLKTTVFPKRVPFSFDSAASHPEKLVTWFYLRQSTEQRCHFHNRLFLVLHKTSDPSLSWTLKAELGWLQSLVTRYLDNFDVEKPMSLQLNNHRFRSDIIWGIAP